MKYCASCGCFDLVNNFETYECKDCGHDNDMYHFEQQDKIKILTKQLKSRSLDIMVLEQMVNGFGEENAQLKDALTDLKNIYTVRGEGVYNLIREAIGEQTQPKQQSSADLHPNLFEEV